MVIKRRRNEYNKKKKYTLKIMNRENDLLRSIKKDYSVNFFLKYNI